MAGFDHLRTADAGIGGPFTPNFEDFGGQILANYISLTSDIDGDGQINENDDEMVAFRLNGDRLERFSTGAIQWQLIADDIEALNFVYLDGSNPPAPTWDPDEIRSVQISLVARGGKVDSAVFIKEGNPVAYTNQRGDIILGAIDDGFRRIQLSREILCRNIGL